MNSKPRLFRTRAVGLREGYYACPFEVFDRDLGVFAKHVVHPERSEKNGVATHRFGSEEAPDEAPS